MRLKFPLFTRCLILIALLLPALGSVAAPQVRILEPRPEQVLPGPDVTVRFAVNRVCLRECGNSLHFMLDNEPFAVQHDPNHPHVLKDVRPGTHTLRVYLANRMHEAIRGTLALVTFSVAYPNDENRPAPGAPLLTYVLPQGEYLGVDAADISVDYLVNNVALAPGCSKVVYSVNGRRFFVEDGAPRHLKDLPPGYHTIRMELQDEFGDLIEGPFNSIERTILVSPDSTVGQTSLPETYPQNLPKISSIKGPMTMGRPWRAVEKPMPMTEEQVQASQRLTVRRSDAPRAVDLDDEDDIAIEERVPVTRTIRTEVETEVTEEEDDDDVQATVIEETRAEIARREAGPVSVATELSAPSAAAIAATVTPASPPPPATTPAPQSVETTTQIETTTQVETTTQTKVEAPVTTGTAARQGRTTGARQLDNRLDRQAARTANTTTTIRADAPTTGGRSRVQSGETTATRVRDESTTAARRNERREGREGREARRASRADDNEADQGGRVRERNPQRLERRTPPRQGAPSETAQ